MSQFCTRFVTCHCTFKLPHETLRKRHRNRATRRQEPAHAALWAPGEPCYTPRPASCRVASLRACCPTCAAKTSSYAQNLRSGGDFSQPGQAIDLLLLLPLPAARRRLLRCGLVDCRDVSPARVAMSCNTGAADDCRTTSARADLRAASAASRDLLGAWLGPF